jgi:DNA-binding NarL/FixJ family response regulator
MAGSVPIQVLTMLGNDQSSTLLRNSLAKIQDLSLADEAAYEAEVLQKLKQRRFDVVLLDLSLRDVDVINLGRLIRQSYTTVRVLILSSLGRSSDIFAAMDAGADGYVLKGNLKGLESAIRTVQLGAIWLDPGIAAQVLEAIVSETSSYNGKMRTLPTGFLPIPLAQNEKDLLTKVATSDCVDGVCMVNPDFLKKLRRFDPAQRGW